MPQKMVTVVEEYPNDEALTLRVLPQPAARLSEALENNEFTLYCQPICALSGPAGYPMAEVLVRMRDEETALLPPGEFLPVFEHFRMMPQLDRWVVRHAIHRLSRGSRVPCFTINLSGQTLEDQGFPRFVAEELTASGVAARTVLFEIDESDAIAACEVAARLAVEVRTAGCGVVIDSFGSRPDSFASLKTLRANFVKVDGSIVRKLLTSELASKKMAAILRLCKSIGIGVIGECVEDQDILIRLKALGVGYAQGFGIYHPQPVDVIAG